MKPVLFVSLRPLHRAENLKAVFDAYDGDKVFIRANPMRRHPGITSGAFDLMVIDEFPAETPGKAIAIGHGIAGGKTSGIKQPRGYHHKGQGDLITYGITSGTAMVHSVAEYSAVPDERMLPLGMPRTDAYIGKKKGDGETPLAKKRAYLYAPTFRAGEETKAPEIDWEKLDRELTDDELFVVKGHMIGGWKLHKEYRHIIEVSRREPSAPYLYDCDVLITDYSTILFDGYLLGKPAVLYTEKDMGYLETRGMQMKYPDMYCPNHCTDEYTLLKTLRSANGIGDAERKIIHHVADMCDGHACERVCDLIRELA